MSDINEIVKQIRLQRHELEMTIIENNFSLTDKYIIDLSQSLDKLLNSYGELAVTKVKEDEN